MQPAHGNGPGPPGAPGLLQLVGAGQPAEQCSGGSQAGKQRKPYTLVKAREKWTDEEHIKFVEGVRLHGRQWRKIEGQSASLAVLQDVSAA